MFDPRQPPRPLSPVIEDCATHALEMKAAWEELEALRVQERDARSRFEEAKRRHAELDAELQHAILVFAQTRASVAKSSPDSSQPPL